MAVDGDVAQAACEVLVSPPLVDAGGELTLRVRIAPGEPRDLGGRIVEVRDHDGNVAGTAALAEFDGESWWTGELKLPAPMQPGRHIWRASLTGADGAEFAVEVRAHRTSVLVWQIPPTVEVGESFQVRVGVKCSSGCAIARRSYRVLAEDGSERAAGTLALSRWAGEAMHSAEIALPAPAEAGQYRWRVVVPATEDAPPHDGGEAGFGLRVVPRPDVTVTVEVTDETGAPIPRANVVLHPYRRVTDADGRACIDLPRGEYVLFVSATRKMPYRQDLSVTEETGTRVEMLPEPPPARE